MNTLYSLLEAALQTSASMAARLSGTRRQWWGILASGYAGIYSTWMFPASGTTFTPIRFAGRSRSLWRRIRCTWDKFSGNIYHRDRDSSRHATSARSRAVSEDPPENACRVRIRGDFLFHCHVEEHMMAGLAGLVRARQYIWISDELSKTTRGGIAL